MPIIRVEMLTGRTPEQKRAMVEKVTDAFAETTGANRDVIEVLITEYDAGNWSLGGQLFGDKKSGPSE